MLCWTKLQMLGILQEESKITEIIKKSNWNNIKAKHSNKLQMYKDTFQIKIT